MGLYINSILFRISGTLHFIYINLVKMSERERRIDSSQLCGTRRKNGNETVTLG